jgi:ADP-heptose:LPS heptosyltransferase/GT2 family glycosyltransferase
VIKKQLVIKHKWALGDTVLLTALVRDIQLAYPGQYQITVNTNWTNVWWNNPHIVRADAETLSQAIHVEVGWGDAIKWNSYAKYADRREMKHILAWYHYDFERKTGIHVPVTKPRPDLHMSEQELPPRIKGRYWVILSGGKLDLTAKHWHAHRAQEVVDKLLARGIHCVQAGATHTNHIHPPLQNTTDMLGKTENVRDLWNVIRYADGVICGVTGAMHIAAAFERPCVVYAGGREDPWFEAYVNAFQAFGPNAEPVKVEHKFLHTIGLLECCANQGCWKNRTVALDPQDLTRKAHTLCRQPVRFAHSHPVPKCQDLISSDHVVEAVMDYYDKSVLPPIKIADKPLPTVSIVRVQDGNPAPIENPPQVMREPSTASKVQQPFQKVHPQELTGERVGYIQRHLPLMDHPIIGGKITICVLCYGPYPQLAKTCLSSILATIPPDRIDLRIGLNEAHPDTFAYVKTLPVTKIYANSLNRYKYPVMRDMFWDEQRPITTNYVVWFDDDTWVVTPNWINDLCQTIIDNHPRNYRLFGSLMYHDLAMYAKNGNDPSTWFKSADWYCGRNFRMRGSQKEQSNGSVIDFVTGWCWAIATEAIRKANIPDTRLGHNGGDIVCGEAIHQAGFEIKQWNMGKSLVACPTMANGGRRGYSEKFPWANE